MDMQGLSLYSIVIHCLNSGMRPIYKGSVLATAVEGLIPIYGPLLQVMLWAVYSTFKFFIAFFFFFYLLCLINTCCSSNIISKLWPSKIDWCLTSSSSFDNEMTMDVSLSPFFRCEHACMRASFNLYALLFLMMLVHLQFPSFIFGTVLF